MSDYARPGDLGEALALCAKGGWRVLAGGTDLYAATRRQGLDGAVLDLTGIEALRGIARTAAGWRIGATTTWADITAAPDLPPAFDALRQAAREVGGRQVQNAGTVAGNLCNASPAADGVPPLLALDAAVVIARQGGERRLPLTEFLQGPRKTALGAGEIVTAVEIPAAAAEGRSRFLKLGARAHLVISIAMVAVRVVIRQDRIALAAVAVGSCAPVARRLPAVEAAVVGLPPEDAAACVTDTVVAAGLAPIDDVRATAAYRAGAAAELIRRALDGLAMAGEGAA